MNRHLTKKQMTALAAETLSAGREKSCREHLDSCVKCRENYAKLLVAREPYYRQRIKESPHLKSRILGGVEAAAAAKEPEMIHGALSKKMSRVFLPAAAAVVMVITFIILRATAPDKASVSYVLGARGAVEANGLQVNPGDRLGAGTGLVLGGGGLVEISGSGHRLYLAGPATAGIDRAESSWLWLTVYRYTVERGRMVSVKDPGTPRVRLKFSTPHGELLSRGTRFMLDVDGTGAVVYFFRGKLRVTGPAGAGPVDLEPGMRYRLPGLTRGGPVTPDDERAAEEIEAMGPMEKLKVPSVHNMDRKDTPEEGAENRKTEKGADTSSNKDFEKSTVKDRDLRREEVRERRTTDREFKKENRDIRRREGSGRR